MNDIWGWIFMIVLTLVLLRWSWGRFILKAQYFYVVPLFFLLTLPGDICLVSGWDFSGEIGIPVFDFFIGSFLKEIFLSKEGAFQDYLEFSPSSRWVIFSVAAGYIWTFTAVPFYHLIWKRRGRRTEQPEQQPERPPQPELIPDPQLPLPPPQISASARVEEDIVEGEFEEIVVGETEDVRRRSTILLPPADYYEEEE